MNVFNIKFGLSSGDQNLALDALKNAGHDVIQVSNGLLVKTDLSLSNLKEQFSDLTVEEFNPKQTDLGRDAEVFASST